MSKAVFDTRFFVEHYYSGDDKILQKTRELMRTTRRRYISTIVIHELYTLTLQKEGRETAELRATLLEKDFKIIDVNPQIDKNLSPPAPSIQNFNGGQHNSRHSP